MNMRRLRQTLVAALAACGATAAVAVEITLLSGGAVEPGLKPAVAAFEAATGHVVRVTFNPAPQIAARLDAGEAWDAVIAPVAVLERAARNARVGAERVPVGRVGIGVAIRPGAPVPAIGDTEQLERSILAADSVVFNRASTGIVVDEMLRRLGIAAQVEPKATRHADGASVMEHLLAGHGREVGFGALTEIVLFRERGLRLVGPLPADLQRFTLYVAALPAAGAHIDAARQLLAHLASPAAQAMFARAGIEPAP